MQRRRRVRSVVSELGDGRRIAYSDVGTRQTEWELTLGGLSATEMAAVEELFESTYGRWRTFTFLEPAGNLLAQSEEYGAPEWDNGPLLELTPGIDDPFGGTRAVRVFNAGIVAADVAQTLLVPGQFHYCLSVWARQNNGPEVSLFASTTGSTVTNTCPLTTQWQRFLSPVALGVETESVTFGVTLGEAIGVDLFGMQVDAQLAPGGYQRTSTGGGVHGHARFASDVATVRAQGTDVFDSAIRIISKGN
ncbi:MAG: hypothetical protein ABI811_24025 [Acidobacteriota bacterium]